ncbi:DUF7660 family protein [Hymenobacter swuensis]|uniref:DUF7660 family protein n=1 Tax=Hymenobacter swuensis TaxID=1446467 RepID=UPI0005C55481|nr:hypothetical protein [Hymenobacter swuensis]
MPDKVSTLPPITTHQAFLDFLELLQEDFRGHGSRWENGNLSDYLEAMQAWTADMNGYYRNTGQPVPENVPWQIFADILRAARFYE